MREKRTKFEPRSIVLVSDLQVNTAINLINNLPLDPDRPLEILIRERPKVRGLDQNGLYWKRLGEIAQQAWFNQKQFNTNLWHEHCKAHIMSDEITTKDGEVRSKWIELPDGTTTVISTTDLEKGCFAQYTTEVEVFGAGLGVHFSARQHEPN